VRWSLHALAALLLDDLVKICRLFPALASWHCARAGLEARRWIAWLALALGADTLAFE
jgi:hypothetical protein